MVRDGLWKSIMAGLIYPAVLGNIIYLLFQSFEHIGSPQALEPGRFLLLGGTAAFYFCDYLYMTYTRRFGPLFFVLDCIFVILLFITIHFINDGTRDTDLNVGMVAWLYATFIALYFLWDWHEYRRCTSQAVPCSPKEVVFYLWIFAWEAISFVAFAAVALSARTQPWCLLIVLALVTAAFGVVLVRKWHYYSAGEPP